MATKFQVGDIVKSAHADGYRKNLRYRVHNVNRGGIVDVVYVGDMIDGEFRPSVMYGPIYEGLRVSGLEKA